MMLLITLYWPDDIERGFETYGPFDDEATREKWVAECEQAQARGWRLLDGVRYVFHEPFPIFDPTTLAVGE